MSLASINRPAFEEAVRAVCTAITEFSGADCVMYALVAHGLLSELGVGAVPVAGSAAWRVGKGDCDVISHAPEIHGPVYEPDHNRTVISGMFHCWVEVVDNGKTMIVDTTTWQFAQKAAMLDAADGGKTKVDFTLPCLWHEKGTGRQITLSGVARSHDIGVFAYLRKKAIERIIFNADSIAATRQAVFAAKLCYQSLLKGEPIKVVGLNVNNDWRANRLRQCNKESK